MGSLSGHEGVDGTLQEPRCEFHGFPRKDRGVNAENRQAIFSAPLNLENPDGKNECRVPLTPMRQKHRTWRLCPVPERPCVGAWKGLEETTDDANERSPGVRNRKRATGIADSSACRTRRRGAGGPVHGRGRGRAPTPQSGVRRAGRLSVSAPSGLRSSKIGCALVDGESARLSDPRKRRELCDGCGLSLRSI